MRDSVDVVVSEWAVAEPQLPVAPIEVVLRVGRIRARFDDELAGLFGQFELTMADFTVIAALRRAVRPFTLPQSILMHQLGLTSGTVSVRLNRLETNGIVTRDPSPDDARGVLVTLTDKGAALFDSVAPAHLANEDRLLSALTESERTTLANLLRKLLTGFEHERWSSPLGITVAPAHETRRLRANVGLSDVAGLLILDVLPGSPAARAGLMTGDVLVGIDGTELRSVVTLAEASQNGAPHTVVFVRGTRRNTASLHWAPSRSVS